MDLLPIDLIIVLSSQLEDYKDLLHFKLVSKENNENISRIEIVKMKLFGIFNNSKKVKKCVNIDCYDETEDLFLDNYYHHYLRYIHCHQKSINYDTIYINQTPYKIFSPYCCECFKKYILFGDKPKNKIKNILVDGFVDIEYLS